MTSNFYSISYFRGVGRWCRWCAMMVPWWNVCWTWLPMMMMIGWRDGIPGRLFHWQSVSFFVWILSSFCYDTCVLGSPPCCLEIVGFEWLHKYELNDINNFVQIIDNSSLLIGKNTIVSRFKSLNNLFDYDWLNLSLDTFKLKCKSKFLG